MLSELPWWNCRSAGTSWAGTSAQKTYQVFNAITLIMMMRKSNVCHLFHLLSNLESPASCMAFHNPQPARWRSEWSQPGPINPIPCDKPTLEVAHSWTFQLRSEAFQLRSEALAPVSVDHIPLQLLLKVLSGNKETSMASDGETWLFKGWEKVFCCRTCEVEEI